MVKLKTYANGLRLIVVPCEGSYSVTCGLLVGAGSRYETPENNGISHFLEHMTFKGTPTRTPFAISDDIDKIGGQINAFTNKESTCYYVRSVAENTEKAVDVLSDIFFNSTFDEGELDRERTVILEELNMAEDTPDDLCFDVLAEAHFGKTGLGATILETKENIEKFRRDDVVKYKNEFYMPENTVICFAGKITFEEAEGLCSRYFASKFTRSGFIRPEITSKFIGKSKTVNKDIEQAHICFGFQGVKYASEKTDAATLANAALGGGMSSVLFQKVREELGLAYSVYSFVSSYLDCGSLCIYAGVGPKNKNKATDAIFTELKAFNKRGLTESEFLRSKEQIKSGFVFSRESMATQMLLYAKYLLYTGELFDFDKRLAEINAVTLDDVNDYVRTIDTEHYSSATVARKP